MNHSSKINYGSNPLALLARVVTFLVVIMLFLPVIIINIFTENFVTFFLNATMGMAPTNNLLVGISFWIFIILSVFYLYGSYEYMRSKNDLPPLIQSISYLRLILIFICLFDLLYFLYIKSIEFYPNLLDNLDIFLSMILGLFPIFYLIWIDHESTKRTDLNFYWSKYVYLLLIWFIAFNFYELYNKLDFLESKIEWNTFIMYIILLSILIFPFLFFINFFASLNVVNNVIIHIKEKTLNFSTKAVNYYFKGGKKILFVPILIIVLLPAVQYLLTQQEEYLIGSMFFLIILGFLYLIDRFTQI